jgi:beta-N-acetylhexosaminidase
VTQGAGRRAMLAFDGLSVSPWLRLAVGRWDPAGVSLFRRRNVRDPGQVRELLTALQKTRDPRRPPLLAAADQENGQLATIAGITPFPGAMALGATGDRDLAERVARATALELRAVGVNVNYAPVCDVATNPRNPSLGIRSFGEDPAAVSGLVAATVRGFQAEGVAATLKHFPGKGEASVDPHYELPRIGLDRRGFDEVHLAPFRGGIEAGARLVMVGHYDAPAITGEVGLATSLSSRAVRDVLRRELRFDGVVITDALDMGALGAGAEANAEAALAAGADLLLFAGGLDQDAILTELDVTIVGGVDRVDALRRWVRDFPQPELDVVGSAEHQALAGEVGARSVTLVRNDRGLLPVRLPAEASIVAVMPAPRDLTPADTSASVTPGLGAALRRHHTRVEEIVTGHPPTKSEISALRSHVIRHDLVVVGTLDAFRDPGQADLVAALLEAGPPVITVALRTPHDLAAYPQARTHACTYGITAPSMQALTADLWGAAPFLGRLPAAIPDLYPAGHGIRT